MIPDNNQYQDKSPLTSTPRFRGSDNSKSYEINFINLNSNNNSIKHADSQEDSHNIFKIGTKINESHVSNNEFQVDENLSLCSVHGKTPVIIVKNDYNPIIDNIINLNYSFANENTEIIYKDKNISNSFQSKDQNLEKNSSKKNIDFQSKNQNNDKKNNIEKNNKIDTTGSEDNFRYNLPLENDKISETIDFFQCRDNNIPIEKDNIKNKKSLDLSNISRNLVKIEKFNYKTNGTNNKNKTFMKNLNNSVYNRKRKGKIDIINQTSKNLTERRNEKPHIIKKIKEHKNSTKTNKINSIENGRPKTYLTSKNIKYKQKIKSNSKEQNINSNNLYYETQKIVTPKKKNLNNLELEIENSNEKNNCNKKYNDSFNRTNTVELNSKCNLEINSSKKFLKDAFVPKEHTSNRPEKSRLSLISTHVVNSKNKKMLTSDNYNYFCSDKNNLYNNINKKESNVVQQKKNNINEKNNKVIKGVPIKKWEFLKDFNVFDSNDNINNSNCLTDLYNNVSYTDRGIENNRNNYSKKYLFNEKCLAHIKGKTNKFHTIHKNLNNDNYKNFLKKNGNKKNKNNSLNNTSNNNNQSHIYSKSNFITSTITTNNKKNNTSSKAPLKTSNIVSETYLKFPQKKNSRKSDVLTQNAPNNKFILNSGDSKIKIIIKRKSKVSNAKKSSSRTEKITRSNTDKHLQILHEFNINDDKNENIADRIKYKEAMKDIQKIKVNKLQNKNNLINNNNQMYYNSELLNTFSTSQDNLSNTSSDMNFYWRKNKKLKNLCIFANESLDKYNNKPNFYGKQTKFNEFTENKLRTFSKPNVIHSQDDICGNSYNKDSKEKNSNLKMETFDNNLITRNINNVDQYYSKNQINSYENESIGFNNNISNSASLLYQKPKRTKKIKEGSKNNIIIKNKTDKMKIDINNDDIIKFSILRNNMMNQITQAFSLTVGDEKKNDSSNNGRNENFTIKNSIIDNNESTAQSNDDYKKQ